MMNRRGEFYKYFKKTASGKVDKRTKEYKEMVERAKKARLAKTRAKPTNSKTATKSKAAKSKPAVKRRSDGKIDLRTKEGREIAERMKKARSAKSQSKGIAGLIKNLLK